MHRPIAMTLIGAGVALYAADYYCRPTSTTTSQSAGCTSLQNFNQNTVPAVGGFQPTVAMLLIVAGAVVWVFGRQLGV
jgi:hypothetical protein